MGVLITSHMGFFTTEAMQAIAMETLENAYALENGLPLVNRVGVYRYHPRQTSAVQCHKHLIRSHDKHAVQRIIRNEIFKRGNKVYADGTVRLEVIIQRKETEKMSKIFDIDSPVMRFLVTRFIPSSFFRYPHK